MSILPIKGIPPAASSHCLERTIQRRDQILRLLDPDRQPDRVRADPLFRELILRTLTVGRRRRMDHQRLHVCDICQQGEDRQAVDELFRRLSVPFDLKGKDRAAALGQIFLIQRMRRLTLQRGVMDRLHLRVGGKIVHDLKRILGMPFYPQGERLQPLEQEERMEWRDRGARVPEKDSPHIGGKSSSRRRLGKGNAVVARIRL